MEYVTLNNGVLMPVLGLGTWDLRGRQCVECLLSALECGYRLIDTARMYGNEEEVAKHLSLAVCPGRKFLLHLKFVRRIILMPAQKKRWKIHWSDWGWIILI